MLNLEKTDTITSKNNENKLNQDSRNKKYKKKVHHPLFSSTIPTENSQTLTGEDLSKKTKSNKKLKNIKNRPNNSDIILYEIVFDSSDKKNWLDFDKVREFIITIQRSVNSEYASNLWEVSNSNDDNIKIKKLESLIARYGIIIYFLLKKNKNKEAKNIFLLMIKENIDYIDYHSIKLFKVFNKLQQKYEILKVYPKITKELFNIYSLIIKYCVLFNFTKYKNEFLVRYLALLSLNYKVFKRKMEIRGFSVETRNQIKYWFAIGLHHASYFIINAFCPLKISIKISGLILKMYRNLDENLSTRQEKSILINTTYNQGILFYANNQSDQALKALKLTKQKIISFLDNDYYNSNYNNVNKILQFVDNSKINTSTTTVTKRGQKNSIFQNYFLGLNGINTKELLFNKKIKNYDFQSSNDFVEQIFLNEGNRKKNLKMEDISEIFFLNLNNENTSFLDLDDNSFIKKSVSPIPSLRGSQSEFDKFLKLKEFNIPKYLKEPLFLNIELLMTEIEIDKKNYNLAYEHIKNCIILILIIKQLGDQSKCNKSYEKELCSLSRYLEDIEKNNRDKKLLSQIKSLQNLSLNINQETKKLKKSSKMVSNKEKEKEKIQNNSFYDMENPKISKEIEKFFIFLNTLSIYQIKLLNDTQPTNDNRNDLPIFFHNQFKDTLSSTQRLNLDIINIMSLSRCAILIDPNSYILPSNLKFTSLTKKIDKISEKIKKKITNKNNVQFSFNGSLMNNEEISANEDNNKNLEREEEQKEFDEDNFIFQGTKEFDSFKRIFFSGKCDRDLKLFLINNFIFAMSIIKRSNKREIEDMIEYPLIIIGPIKRFKKNNKERVKCINENKQEILKELGKVAEFQYIINSNHFYLDKNERIKKKNISNSSESISNSIQILSD